MPGTFPILTLLDPLRKRFEYLKPPKEVIDSLFLPRCLALLMLTSILLTAGVVSAQTAIQSDFDHDSTGFRLDGAHLITSCGDCHSRGIFEGTLWACADCHEQGNLVQATSKPARHILTSQSCESCHATRAFVPVRRMDHVEAIGTCVSCHDDRSAPGKSIDHSPSSTICEDCHQTTTFSPVVSFSHAQALGTCSGCHDGGMRATGKDADHVQTAAECDSCHSTVSF